MRKLQQVIEDDKETISKETENLHRALLHFRYEGKPHRGKNLKSIRTALKLLERKLKNHRKYQEKIIFPFWLRHVPKYETAVRFLQSDHETTLHNIQKVKKILNQIRYSPNHVLSKNLQETGVYLLFFLQHHMQMEKKGIQTLMWKHLNPEEKKEIKFKIQRWIEKHPRESF